MDIDCYDPTAGDQRGASHITCPETGVGPPIPRDSRRRSSVGRAEDWWATRRPTTTA